MVADSNDHISKVLDHCVQQIEQGKATMEDCLVRFPAHRAELAELLPLTRILRQAPRIEMPADAVHTGRGLLLESLPPRPLPPRRSLRWRWPPIAMLDVRGVTAVRRRVQPRSERASLHRGTRRCTSDRASKLPVPSSVSVPAGLCRVSCSRNPLPKRAQHRPGGRAGRRSV